MKKYWLHGLLLCLLLHFVCLPTWAQPDTRLTSGFDVGAGWNNQAWLINGQYHQYLKIGRSGIFQIGWGGNVSHLRGNDLDFTTAPSRLTKEKTGLSGLNAPTLLRNIDTLQISSGITSVNFSLSAQISLFGRIDIGASADILGLAFGTRRAGYYLGSKGYNKVDSLNVHQTNQQARPASANFVRLGDNTVGNLNNEIYARLHITPRVGLKVSYLFTTNEYRTTQVLVDDNYRFRFRSEMIFVGLTFPMSN